MNNKTILDVFQDKMTYSGKNVKDMLSDLPMVNKTSSIRRGDVFLSWEGRKRRPCVVIKVLKNDTVLYLSLTSSENINCLSEHKSRFFREGYISNCFGVSSLEFVLENFVGVLDSSREVTKAVKMFKELINKEL